MSYLDFSHSLNKREYMIGRSPETDYYIITYKENKKMTDQTEIRG